MLLLVELQALKVTLLYGCCLGFVNRTNGAKPNKGSHITRKELGQKLSFERAEYLQDTLTKIFHPEPQEAVFYEDMKKQR